MSIDARPSPEPLPLVRPSARARIPPALEDFQNPQKIFLHLDRVLELKDTGDTRPIHMTIGLNNYCNHKCPWCYINWSQAGRTQTTGELTTTIKAVNADDRIIEAVREARALGLKAVTLVGDGEPTLHPRFPEIIAALGGMGLQIGIFSNLGVARPGVIDALVQHCFFVRASIDAATAETHRQTHGANDFDLVLTHLAEIVERRGDRTHPIIGVQFVANQVNVHELPLAARLYRDMGANYLTIKPAYRNVMNPEHPQNTLDPREAFQMMREAQAESTDTFKVYAKFPQFEEVLTHTTNDGRYYSKCQATPLSPYLDEDGNVEMCGNLKGRGFVMGNVNHQSFQEIWASARRKDCLSRIDLSKCPAGCKLDPVNKVLWDAFQPEEDRIHPNFV